MPLSIKHETILRADTTMLSPFDILGLIAFSFSGAVKGISRRLDLFGITVLGILTALGGGVVRDLLVIRIPLMLTAGNYVLCALLGILLALLARRRGEQVVNDRIFLVSDAVGLASFTAGGCTVAAGYGLGIVGIVVMGLSTAVGGGVLRDLLCGEVPLILRSEFYASCALAGSIIFWALLTATGNQPLAAVMCAIVVFVMRLLAIRHRWSLPTFS